MEQNERATHVVVTPASVVFSLSAEHQAKARKCLEESGEIKMSFREISVTNLTDIREGQDGGIKVD